MESTNDIYIDYGIEKGQVWVNKKYDGLKLKIVRYEYNSHCFVHELDSSLNPQIDFAKIIMIETLLKNYEKYTVQ